jgi:hypothetical protein
MNGLPMKKSVKYPTHENVYLPKDIGDDLDLLNKSGVDIGELKRSAITEAVKKAVRKLDKSAS